MADEESFNRDCLARYGLEPSVMQRIYTPRNEAQGMVCGVERIPARRLAMDTLVRASKIVGIPAAKGSKKHRVIYHRLNEAVDALDRCASQDKDKYTWPDNMPDVGESRLMRFAPNRQQKAQTSRQHLSRALELASEGRALMEVEGFNDIELLAHNCPLRLTDRAAYVIAEMLEHQH